jgi:hypothetical protein
MQEKLHFGPKRPRKLTMKGGKLWMYIVYKWIKVGLLSFLKVVLLIILPLFKYSSYTSRDEAQSPGWGDIDFWNTRLCDLVGRRY